MRKEAARSGTLVLTYDDGPSNTVTPRLLDILRRHDAHASFFMLGCNAQLNPEVADRIIEAGHEVGCHSDQHLNAWKVVPWRAVADINAGYDSLSRWLAPDAMFRPPYGKITLSTYRSIWSRRAPLGWWTIDSGDTRMACPNPNTIVKTVEEANGGVVLMHDLARSPEREDFVCELTSLLLDLAKKRSLNVKCLSAFAHDCR
jgi:peptidoglycan/xylan/chitin deacetylase (PgdA/CDA1 family)